MIRETSPGSPGVRLSPDRPRRAGIAAVAARLDPATANHSVRLCAALCLVRATGPGRHHAPPGHSVQQDTGSPRRSSAALLYSSPGYRGRGRLGSRDAVVRAATKRLPDSHVPQAVHIIAAAPLVSAMIVTHTLSGSWA
jgi:hypothetical protein